VGVDNDPELLRAVRRGACPFEEPLAQEVLERTAVDWTDEIRRAAGARHIVITLGTPAFSTSRSTCARSAACSTTCSPTCARATR
jgi:UDP-glucose 6-dehydrogenase